MAEPSKGIWGKIHAACEDTEHGARMRLLLGSEMNALKLLSACDDSPYALSEWLEALDLFYHKLIEAERETDAETMIGYLVCCAESQAQLPVKLSLADVFSEMYTEYGYAG